MHRIQLVWKQRAVRRGRWGTQQEQRSGRPFDATRCLLRFELEAHFKHDAKFSHEGAILVLLRVRVQTLGLAGLDEHLRLGQERSDNTGKDGETGADPEDDTVET